MELQNVLHKNLKRELYLDITELITGVVLVGFLWTHMLLESSILVGVISFDHLSRFLDLYYLTYIGIPLVIIVFLTHFIVAGRRIPTRYKEQKIIWHHAQMIRHTDTWTWVFQVITGMALLIVAGIHMFVVIADWPIEAMTSAARIHQFLPLYLLLLLLAVYHAGVGLYRQFVKWGWVSRRPVAYIILVITVVITGLSVGTLWAFARLGGAI